MKITALTNGPLLVIGQAELVDQNGRAFTHPVATKFALCRCGGSSNKPFCDGSHAKNGFVCPPQPEEQRHRGAVADGEGEGGSVGESFVAGSLPRFD